MTANILPACGEAEFDEQWSFVGRKSNQRWLWYAVDHKTNALLAYVFGRIKDEIFRKLEELFSPFGIQKFYTENWAHTSEISMKASMW